MKIHDMIVNTVSYFLLVITTTVNSPYYDTAWGKKKISIYPDFRNVDINLDIDNGRNFEIVSQ